MIDRENIQENARTVGDHLKNCLCELQERQPLIGEVRGLGLMWGVEFAVPPDHPASGAPGRAVVDAAFRNGLLVYPAGGALPGSRVNQILVGPPLTITDPELAELGTLLRRSVREALA